MFQSKSGKIGGRGYRNVVGGSPPEIPSSSPPSYSLANKTPWSERHYGVRSGSVVELDYEKVPILGARRELMTELCSLEEALVTPLRGELALTNGELG
jgi:hypothetical protein